MVLERDDRGGANDFIVVNGKKIASPIREEIVTVRGIVPGEYTVNIRNFWRPLDAGAGDGQGAEAESDHPGDLRQQIFVDHTGDEKTAVRFTLDAAGKVIDVNSRPKSLMENFRNVHHNGADLDPKTDYVKNYDKFDRPKSSGSLSPMRFSACFCSPSASSRGSPGR